MTFFAAFAFATIQLLIVALRPRNPDYWKLKCLIAERQIQILNRRMLQYGLKPRFTKGDRVFFACFAKVLDHVKGSFYLMKPKTVMNWYLDLLARRWTHPSGPPGTTPR